MEEKFKLNKGIKTKYDNGDGLFFTSDTHFYHDNIIKFCNRPWPTTEEMNEGLIERWNSVVGPNDTVFHLGDFCWGGAPKWHEILEQLNGHKILILGNHDMKNLTSLVASEYFDYVTFQMQLNIEGRSVYLNHYPFLCYGGSYRGPENKVWQFFGHVHSKEGTSGADKDRLAYLFDGQYDVGVDNNDYRPISWQQIKEKLTK